MNSSKMTALLDMLDHKDSKSGDGARSSWLRLMGVSGVAVLCTIFVFDAIGMRSQNLFSHCVVQSAASASASASSTSFKSIPSEEEDFALLESIHDDYPQSHYLADKYNERLLRQKSMHQSKLLDDSPTFGHPQPHFQKKKRLRELKLLQKEDDVDCSKYQHTLSITDKLRINYVVNVVQSSPGGGTFQAEMVYHGRGWLGFAHSEQSGMVGSTAIVGLPDATETDQRIQKYKLGDPTQQQSSPESILQAFPPAKQTLLNTSLIQNDNTTVMRFTKLLSEPSELTIHPDWPNKFLFAHGSSNEVGIHATRGLVVLDLVPCFPSKRRDHNVDIARPGDRLEEPEDANDEDRYESSSNYVINVGHGYEEQEEDPPPIEPIQAKKDPPPIVPVEHVEPIPIQEKPMGEDSSTSSSAEPDMISNPDLVEEIQQFDIPDQFTVDDDHLKSLPLSYTHPTKGIEVWWTIHGLCAMLSCGVLLPIVIASSILQGCCGAGKKKEQQHPSAYYDHNHNKIYRWSNFLLIIGVMATFVSAVIGATKDATHDNNHDDDDTPIEKSVNIDTMAPNHNQQAQGPKPNTYHSPAGLALFIVCLFFALLGNLRSYLTTAGGFFYPSPEEEEEQNDSQEDNQEEESKSNFNSDTIKSSVNQGFAGNTARRWDQCHSLVGVVLLFVTWWQCQSGLDLFEYRFDDSWFTRSIFWGTSGTCAGVLGFACILQMLYLMIQWCYKTAYW